MSTTASPPRPPPPASVDMTGGPALPPLGPPPEPEPPRRPRVRWLLLGCVVVLLASAGASAVFVVEQVNNITKAIDQNPSLKVGRSLTPAGYGSAQTILLVGNDTRSVFKYYNGFVPNLANEMLLVRLDPNKPYISMMSIPRELWVTIYPPGRLPYTNRINSAYTFGIPTLVSTIKRVTGLSINHVVVITFTKFEQAVNEIGCVYSTVDRRYYHLNVPGGPQYQQINLQPGYQDMCGSAAEQFVSYRHGDTSLIRDARDQSFLLDVKKQYGPTLIDNIGKFEHIFGQVVQTDPSLHTNTGVLSLLGTLISSASLRVRQVQFQATLGASFDTATPQQIHESVHSFLYGSSSVQKSRTAKVARAVHKHKSLAGLAPTSGSELAQAAGPAAHARMTLEYPRVQARGGTVVPVDIRDYEIHAPGGAAYSAYVEVFAQGDLGQFYDVQGSAWTTPPLLDSPNQSVRVAGRTYYLYYTGQHLQVVAWYEHGAVYWVHNTLSDSLGNAEILAIAEQTYPLTGERTRTPRTSLSGVTAPPPVTTSPTALSTRELLGSLGGLLAVVTAPLLLIALIIRRRQLSAVRARLHATAVRTAQLEVAVAGAAARLPASPAPAPGGYAPPTVYRGGSWWRRPAVVVGVGVLAVAVAGGIAVVATGALAGRASAPPRHVVVRRPPVPTVRVAVLNATSIQGAAGRLAKQLRAERVRIGVVGNVTESRPPGLLIMYPPGSHRQALLLAHLLRRQKPTIVPIDPVVQAAAGALARLVVVIA